MGRTTNQAERRNPKNRKRIGFWLAIVLLFGAAQLYGKGEAAASRASISQAPKAPQHVLIVSIPDRRLAVMADGHVLKIYDVAVGKASTPSPRGELKIANKVVNPAYFHKGRVVRPGPWNPLGDRWMGLSKRGYGIHGTNVQSSVGTAASHGCFRMRKRDVEELFAIVRVGDVVEVRGERDAQWASIFAAPEPVEDSTAATSAAAPAPGSGRPGKIHSAPPPTAVAMAVMAGAIGN